MASDSRGCRGDPPAASYGYGYGYGGSPGGWRQQRWTVEEEEEEEAAVEEEGLCR